MNNMLYHNSSPHRTRRQRFAAAVSALVAAIVLSIFFVSYWRANNNHDVQAEFEMTASGIASAMLSATISECNSEGFDARTTWMRLASEPTIREWYLSVPAPSGMIVVNPDRDVWCDKSMSDVRPVVVVVGQVGSSGKNSRPVRVVAMSDLTVIVDNENTIIESWMADTSIAVDCAQKR